MGAITIDKLGARALAKLEMRAQAHGKSVEEEATAILEAAIGEEKSDPAARLAFADKIAAMTPRGVVQDDSTLFIRAERDREG